MGVPALKTKAKHKIGNISPIKFSTVAVIVPMVAGVPRHFKIIDQGDKVRTGFGDQGDFIAKRKIVIPMGIKVEKDRLCAAGVLGENSGEHDFATAEVKSTMRATSKARFRKTIISGTELN